MFWSLSFGTEQGNGMDGSRDGRTGFHERCHCFFFANNGTNERTINMTDLLLTLVDLHFFWECAVFFFFFVGLFFLLKGVEATLGGFSALVLASCAGWGFVVFEGFEGFVRTWGYDG